MGKSKSIKSLEGKYDSFFNKSTYSDVSIKLKNGDSLTLHKIILSKSSDYFEKNLKDVTELTLEDDEKLSKSLLSFLYGTNFEYSNEEELFNFILLLKNMNINLLHH